MAGGMVDMKKTKIGCEGVSHGGKMFVASRDWL